MKVRRGSHISVGIGGDGNPEVEITCPTDEAMALCAILMTSLAEPEEDPVNALSGMLVTALVLLNRLEGQNDED